MNHRFTVYKNYKKDREKIKSLLLRAQAHSYKLIRVSEITCLPRRAPQPPSILLRPRLYPSNAAPARPTECLENLLADGPSNDHGAASHTPSATSNTLFDSHMIGVCLQPNATPDLPCPMTDPAVQPRGSVWKVLRVHRNLQETLE